MTRCPGTAPRGGALLLLSLLLARSVGAQPVPAGAATAVAPQAAPAPAGPAFAIAPQAAPAPVGSASAAAPEFAPAPAGLAPVGPGAAPDGLVPAGAASAVAPQAAAVPPADYRVVVSVHRQESRLQEAPRSIEQLPATRILELRPRSIPEALGGLPGVYVQQTNRGAGTPILRGLIGPQNLLLVDDVRFSTSTHRTGPHQYLSTFAPEALERVEVLRGPSSVLYGNGAMGGVIQLLSAGPPAFGPGARRWAGRIDEALSSADGSSVTSAEVGGELPGSGLRGLVGGGFGQFGTLRAGGAREQLLSDYGVGSWRAKLVQAPAGSAWSLTGAYFGMLVRDAWRVEELGRGDLRSYDNDDHLAYLALQRQGQEVLRRLKLVVSYHRTAEHVERFGCPTSGAKVVLDPAGCVARSWTTVSKFSRFDDEVDVLGADVSGSFDLFSRRLRVNVGLDEYFELIGSTSAASTSITPLTMQDKPRGNFSDGSTYNTLGAYAHGELTLLQALAGGVLLGTGGVRYSRFAAFAPEVPGLGDVHFDHQGVVGAGGLQWLRGERLNLYASLVQGFRSPNLQEATVLGDTGSRFAVPNDSLRPERSDTLELGGRLRLGPLAASVSAWQSWRVDSLDEAPASYEGQTEIDGKRVMRRVNALSGRYRGLDGTLALTRGPLTLSAAATWTEGEVTLADGSTHPGRLVPPLFGSVGARLERADHRGYAELFVEAAAAQTRLHPTDEADLRICETAPYSGVLQQPCDGTPARATLNLRAGWRPAERLRVDLALLNATDERYRTHGSGVDAPGIEGKVGLGLEF